MYHLKKTDQNPTIRPKFCKKTTKPKKIDTWHHLTGRLLAWFFSEAFSNTSTFLNVRSDMRFRPTVWRQLPTQQGVVKANPIFKRQKMDLSIV